MCVCGGGGFACAPLVICFPCAMFPPAVISKGEDAKINTQYYASGSGIPPCPRALACKKLGQSTHNKLATIIHVRGAPYAVHGAQPSMRLYSAASLLLALASFAATLATWASMDLSSASLSPLAAATSRARPAVPGDRADRSAREEKDEEEASIGAVAFCPP